MFQKPNTPSITMLSRSVRAETRQSRKEDIKRVMHSIDKVIHIAYKSENFNILKEE